MYRLPTGLRAVFQEPFGPVVQTEDLPSHVKPGDRVVCIGDLVSRTAIWLGLSPTLIIVDYRSERAPVDEELRSELVRYGQTVLRVANPAATVTPQLYGAVVEAFRLAGPVRIEVDGEEDLAGLPVFAEAPQGTVVLYGMPGRGIVVVRVDETMRRRARDLLERMRDPAGAQEAPGPTGGSG